LPQVSKNWTVPTRGVGLPDYSTSAPVGSGVPQGALYTNSDSGELASRLGAYNSIDRRGNVVLHDNFESGVEAWPATLGAGAGAAKEWSTESFRSGGFSMKVSGGLATTTRVTRNWGVNNPNKAGIEFSFAVEFFNTLMGINYYSDNVNIYFAAWALMAQQLLVWDRNVGLVVVVNNLEILYGDNTYNGIKLVWDTVTGQYTRILCNQLEVDISRYQVPFLPAVLVGKYMQAEFQIASRAAANDSVYIDDFIATVNEPNNT